MKTKYKQVVITLMVILLCSIGCNIYQHTKYLSLNNHYSKVVEQHSQCVGDYKELESLHTVLGDRYDKVVIDKENLEQQIKNKDDKIKALEREVTTLKKK